MLGRRDFAALIQSTSTPIPVLEWIHSTSDNCLLPSSDQRYLAPSFSNALDPCSSHSALDIHMFSLSAICKRLDGASRTETVIAYNICQHSTTKEDHVPPPWWILDADLEFLKMN